MPELKHVWHVCPPTCENPTCMFCEGGLGLCTVCGGFEGSLLPSCPGHRLTQEEHDKNYSDFCHGRGPFDTGVPHRIEREAERLAKIYGKCKIIKDLNGNYFAYSPSLLGRGFPQDFEWFATSFDPEILKPHLQ